MVLSLVEGYDASSKFYTYGFDWYPDRLRWWMIHPTLHPYELEVDWMKYDPLKK